ncbi:restriction endonuclease subunit S [Clostridium sporogenes]
MSENEKNVPRRRFREFQNAKGWEQRKLGEALSLLKDGTHGTHNDVDNGVYLLSAKNIKNGIITIDAETDRMISEEEYKKIHKNFQLNKGDVLLTIVGSIGESAIIENPGNITFQRSVAYLRPNDKITSNFLLATINTSKFKLVLKNRQVVSAQPGIYLGVLEAIPFQYPTKVEQEKIGTFFRNLDNLITLHQRKLEKMKALKKAYLTEMFPAEGERKPKRRFAGFTEDWKQRKLEEVTSKIGSGKTPLGGEKSYKDDGVYLIRSQNVNYDTINFSDVVYIDDEIDEEMKNSRVFNGDVLLNITGASIGRSAVFHSTQRANVNQHVCIVRPLNKEVSPEFIHLNLTSNNGQNQINSSQAGGAREGLNFQQISKMTFMFPKLEEQIKIGDFFSKLDNLSTLHQRKLEKLQNIKKAYLNEMFI